MPQMRHEVVISGISCRLPDCDTLKEFKNKLFSKADCVRQDLLRWNPAEDVEHFYSGKMLNQKRFDGGFFGMHPKLVDASDPTSGHLLETSMEAMIDAGFNAFTNKGNNVAVISANSFSDSELLNFQDSVSIVGQGMVGNSRSMMANRISYFFDFKGPSYNLNSEWTSAVDALDVAVNLVADGKSDAAIVASCNIMFFKALDAEYRALGLLDPSGKSSPFDAQADGFSRSEATGALFIQRAQDAKRHYATIVQSRSRCLGDRPQGFMQINPSLRDFLKEFYRDCGVDPADVAYVETGGVCKKLNDAEELNAVAEVFCSEKKSPLLVGSVKGNVGHSDAMAGFVSLVKAIIALETGVIPPTLYYNNPNLHVPALISGKLKPVTELTDLSGDFVAVNCFNFSGTSSHILLKRNSKTKKTLSVGDLPADRLPRLVILQARHEKGANDILDEMTSVPVDTEFVSLVNDVYKTQFSAYLYRAYAILPTSEKDGKNIKVHDPVKKPLWFIFSGMGSQWTGMGQELLLLPTFAASIDKCDAVLRPLGVDIKEILISKDDKVLDNILNCFVGIAAIQIGLVDVLTSIGVTPDGIMGHSVGELGCAYADGCLTAQETILAAYYRGKASVEADYNVVKGMMAAVGLGYTSIKDEVPTSIDVACHNSGDSCTLSGPNEDITQYVEQLKTKGVFAKAVSAGGIAYHSRYIKTIGTNLLKYCRKVIPNPKQRSSRWVSSSVPEARWNTQDARMCSAEYLTNNLLSPVLFEEAGKHLPKDAVLIEIAPHGLLQAILRRSVSNETINIPLTSRTAESNLITFLSAIGKLYINNVDLDVNSLYKKVEYPVSRGTPSLVTLVTWDHDLELYKAFTGRVNKILNRDTREKSIAVHKGCSDYRLWRDHRFDNDVFIPISQLMMYPWKMVLSASRLQYEEACLTIENVLISSYFFVKEYEQAVLVTFTPGTLRFEVSRTEDGLNFSNILMGKISTIDPIIFTIPPHLEDKEDREELDEEEIYCALAQYGLNFGPQYRNIHSISIGKSDCIATLIWTGNIVTFIDALFTTAILVRSEQEKALNMPIRFTKLTINTPALMNLPNDGLVEIHHDYRCNRLVCVAMELCGLILGPVTFNKQSDLNIREIAIQPYFKNQQSIYDLFLLSIQLAGEPGFSLYSKRHGKLTILRVSSDNDVIVDTKKLFYDAIESQTFYSVNTLEVNLETAKDIIESADRRNLLVVGASNVVESLTKSVSHQENIYYLTNIKANKNKSFSNTSIIYMHNDGLVLLKKTRKLQGVKLFEMQGPDWQARLHDIALEGDQEQLIFFVCHHQAPRLLLPVLAAESFAHLLRVVFILDDNAPRFSLTSSFYSDQLALGLSVNILCDGFWGRIEFSNNAVVQTTDSTIEYIKSSEKDLQLSYCGLNTTNFNLGQETSKEQADVEYVDYSGYIGHKKVLGFGKYDLRSGSMIPDRVLRWFVPSNWTLEDAATVPAYYSLAYFVFITRMTDPFRNTENVLVHAGMSPIGQAFIRIALSFGCHVTASVCNEEEKKALKKLLPSVLFIHELGTKDIAISILGATKGKKFDLVVNCLQGGDLQTSLNLLARDGQLFNLSGTSSSTKEYIGMSFFIRNTSFIPANLTQISGTDNKLKSKIKELLQEGIERGIVVPLQRSTFDLKCQQNAGLKNLWTKNAFEKTLLQVEDTKVSILPSGSHQFSSLDFSLLASTRTDRWLDVAEWLVGRGVTKMVVLSAEDIPDSLSRRFNKLMSCTNVSLVVTSLIGIDSHEKAVELFKRIILVGQITSFYCIGMDENSSTLQSLDSACRQLLPKLRHFISLLGDGSEVSDSRAKSGLPVCSLQSSSPLSNPAQVLPYLSTILAESSTTDARFFFISNKAKDSEKSNILDMQSFLPSSLNQLCKISDSVSEKPRFFEVPTLSPRYIHVRNSLLPIFIIPGLGMEILKPLFYRLMHPTFCCSLPAHVISTESLANALMEDVVTLRPEGPYNIIGDTWSGAVALILGCLLEDRDQKVSIILLEGAPTSIQYRLKTLREKHRSDLGPSILAEIFNFSNEEVKNTSNISSWKEQLKDTLKKKSVKTDISDHVASSLNYLYTQLTAVLNTQPPKQQFTGRVTVISCKSMPSAHIEKLAEYCKGEPNCVVTNDEQYSDLLASATTAKIVNDNVAFDLQVK